MIYFHVYFSFRGLRTCSFCWVKLFQTCSISSHSITIILWMCYVWVALSVGALRQRLKDRWLGGQWPFIMYPVTNSWFSGVGVFWPAAPSMFQCMCAWGSNWFFFFFFFFFFLQGGRNYVQPARASAVWAVLCNVRHRPPSVHQPVSSGLVPFSPAGSDTGRHAHWTHQDGMEIHGLC
jgi:hypothetical protein